MKTKNTISKEDSVKATGYDTNGNYICHIYDSGYSRISQIINAVDSRAPKYSAVKKVMICNTTKEWCDTYTISGKKI